MAGEARGAGFLVDEEPLRQAVLKAYHEKRGRPGPAAKVLAAVRQFLSGAPGSNSVAGRYWFEEDPVGSAARFVEDLERAAPGLGRGAVEPLLVAVRDMEAKRRRELSPNLAVYVASLAGPLALKAGIDETLAASVVAAAIIGLSRAGRGPFEAAVARRGGS
ncbi:MAG: hypothetical protein HY721_04645 [Planctomycetes bacterium]|nr:hypothetical protein [Planctomycetota bacterium]